MVSGSQDSTIKLWNLKKIAKWKNVRIIVSFHPFLILCPFSFLLFCLTGLKVFCNSVFSTLLVLFLPLSSLPPSLPPSLQGDLPLQLPVKYTQLAHDKVSHSPSHPSPHHATRLSQPPLPYQCIQSFSHCYYIPHHNTIPTRI